MNSTLSEHYPEKKKLKDLILITETIMPKCEIRGVFKIVEDGPAGDKCYYQERPIKDLPLDNLYGGTLLVCPIGDRTNGKTLLEICTRSNTIWIADKTAGKAASKLASLYEAEADYKFKVDDIENR